MFVISASKTVKSSVVVEMLDQSGVLKKHPFNIEVKRMDQAEWDRLFEELKGDDAASLSVSLERNAELFYRVITDWDGVIDDDQKPVAYTHEALVVAMTGPDGPAVSRALFDSIANVRFGVVARKN